ncbi:MAG: ATP-binding protein [Nodosilinea sp.]
MSPSPDAPRPSLETLLHHMTDRIRQSLELSEILAATVTEMRAFLKTDRVKVYRFDADGSGEVVAESIQAQRLPSLLGHRFPAEDIPQQARELFLTVRQRHIVNVAKQEIGISPLRHPSPHTPPPQATYQDLWFRQIDPCHVEYLTNMGVQSSLVVPVLHEHQLWGLLVAHHSQPRRVGPRQLEVVQMVADQVSVALAHAMLLNQSRLHAQHEAAINQVVALLHKAPGPSLHPSLEKTVKTLGGLGGRLYLNRPQGNTWGKVLTTGPQPQPLRLLSNAHQSPSLADDGLAPPNVPPLESLLAWRGWLRTEVPAQPGELLWAVNNLNQSKIPPPLRSPLESQDICGILVAQLTYRNQHLGYLSIFRRAIEVETIWAGRLDTVDPRQHRPRASFETWREITHGQAQPWTPQEIDLAKTLAYHFAQVIYQGYLYSQIRALNTELEGRVVQRTAELQQANTSLKREIAERENTLQQLHRAKNTLKRLSRQNELILQSAGEGIYGLDLHGQITFANPAAAETLGYSTNSLLGQFMHQLVDPTSSDQTPYIWEQSPIFNTLKMGTTHHRSGDFFRRYRGGLFPVEYISTPLEDQGKILGAVVIFKDITERQMVDRLKDEFISVVSHELRTPLTSIRTALGLLVQQNLAVPPEKRQRMTEIAFSNTNRLVRLVNDILDIERIKLGKVNLNKQACDLSKLINQAADEMQAIADKNSIRIAVPSISLRLWVDPDRIIQTLANLLSNAIKFSPKDSTVSIRAEVCEAENLAHRNQDSTRLFDATKAARSVETEDVSDPEETIPRTLLISVKDEGKGIPEDKLETIFEQFEQLHVLNDEHRGGAGLGLAICRSIVEQHGGKIWAESILNQGSTFFFTLPIARDSTEKSSQDNETAG